VIRVAPIVLVVLAITLAGAAMLAHEAVELLAVLGLAQIGHIFVEGVDLGVETGAFLFEAAKLLGAIFVESGIARRSVFAAAEAAMHVIAAHIAHSLVPVALGLSGGPAEFFAPQDIAEHGQ